MQKEKLSALMDGESFDSELLSSLSQDRTLQQSWQSYHLIRDTLRGDIGQVMHFDIADRVAAARERTCPAGAFRRSGISAAASHLAENAVLGQSASLGEPDYANRYGGLRVAGGDRRRTAL